MTVNLPAMGGCASLAQMGPEGRKRGSIYARAGEIISALLSTLEPGRGLPVVEEKIRLCTPLCWGSVGLRSCTWLPVRHDLIPSSQFWPGNQFSGSVPFCFRSFSHVYLATSLVNLLSCLALWAVIRFSLVLFVYLLVWYSLR
jgi:hypothetical protein